MADDDDRIFHKAYVRADIHEALVKAHDTLAADKAELLVALQTADAAIAEYFRYLDGGEMRGSYDGKPERNQLRKAGYATRALLDRHAAPAKGECL